MKVIAFFTEVRSSCAPSCNTFSGGGGVVGTLIYEKLYYLVLRVPGAAHNTDDKTRLKRQAPHPQALDVDPVVEGDHLAQSLVAVLSHLDG